MQNDMALLVGSRDDSQQGAGAGGGSAWQEGVSCSMDVGVDVGKHSAGFLGRSSAVTVTIGDTGGEVHGGLCGTSLEDGVGFAHRSDGY